MRLKELFHHSDPSQQQPRQQQNLPHHQQQQYPHQQHQQFQQPPYPPQPQQYGAPPPAYHHQQQQIAPPWQQQQQPPPPRPPHPTTRCGGALGANFNENLNWADHEELRRVGATWIRGFVDMTAINASRAEQSHNIKALHSAIDAGFKTICSLKMGNRQFDFPSPGSPELEKEMEKLDAVLRLVMGRADIIVVGNEPFIEVKQGQGGKRLNNYYEAAMDRTIAFRRAMEQQNQRPCPTRLFMGALNRLDMPGRRTPAVERMLAFIASRPELDGVDLHLHMPKLHQHQAMLDWALPRIRPDQTFVATEFSMIWHWGQHIRDEASPHYCSRYGVARGTKVHEVITAFMENPVPRAQWEEFLANEPWYAEQRGFMASALRMYRATGRLEVATYGFTPMRNRKRPLAANDNPWLLNSVMAPSTVQLGPEGKREDNFPWAEEFRRIQRGETG